MAGERSVEFDIEIAEGMVVVVEGLDPNDGGPLSFGVQTRELHGPPRPTLNACFAVSLVLKMVQ